MGNVNGMVLCTDYCGFSGRGDWSSYLCSVQKFLRMLLKHVRAKLARTETERSEFEGPDGKIYSKITAMVLVFW